MKRGLTQTLMTVAIALLGYQALAMAPVIGNIPDPVVGSGDSATQAAKFVWPDAIHLDSFVTDDQLQPNQVKWYYRIEGTALYALNGVPSLTSGEAAASTPAEVGALSDTKRIDNQSINGEDPATKSDGNTRTVTIRNIHFSPLGSAEVDPGSTTGILSSETQVVTLYASDGTSYSTKELTFYTDNGGNDRWYGEATWEPVRHYTLDNTTHDSFTYLSPSDVGMTTGNVTSGNESNTALCFTSSLDGGNMAYWVSPWGAFSVDQNSVFKIRANLSGSYATAGKVPFWDMYVDNYTGSAGLNLFAQDLLVLDNAGGADAVLNTSGGKDFFLYFAPICIGTPQWDANYAGLATGDNLKARFIFRLLDVGEHVQSSQRDGKLCLTDLEITKIPISAMTVQAANVYSVTSFVRTTSSATGNTLVDTYGSALDFTGGVVTITPNSTTQNFEYLTLSPGTNNQYDLGTPTTIADNFPVAWESNQLYQITYDLAAPGTAGGAAESNPFKAIYIGVDTPQNEVLMETYITNEGPFGGTPSSNVATPKAGTAQTYQAFWWSHTASQGKSGSTTVPQYIFFRPRLSLLNNTALTKGNGSGGLKVSKVAVNKVTFE